MNRWDKPEYQRMSEVAFRNGELLVRFEDGDKVVVRANALLPPGDHDVSWDDIETNAYEIAVDLDESRFEIPWSSIRSLTDPDYNAHVERMAEERSQLIGVRLRKLRETRGLSAKEVAERAGISAQSLSRIENARHDVVFSTLEKILAAMGASLRDLADAEREVESRNSLVLDGQHRLTSLKQIAERLSRYGFSETFIGTRITPRPAFRNELEQVRAAVSRFSRLFDCSPTDIASGQLHVKLLNAGAFKMPRGATSLKTAAYAIYAHQLCLSTLLAFDRPWTPLRSGEFIDAFRAVSKLPTYEALLRFVWSLGIPVLPLADSGGFHGACWMIGGRPVVVLKQRTEFHARWLFDLAHELGHVLRHLVAGEGSFVDANEIIPFNSDDPKEDEANDFAHELLLQSQHESLIAEIVQRARGSIPLLKRATIEVAASDKVPVDLLANYLAHRLSLQKESWWGTANNLQSTQPSPLLLSREVYLSTVDLSRLEPEQRDLLLNALKDW